jgi:hypothetical protein
MKISDAFPSRYLKAGDVDDIQMPLVISHVEVAEMQDGARKPVVFFEGMEKGLVLNKTNSNVIAAAYGDDTDDWPHHQVHLMSVPTEYQGKTVDAIRVRVRQAKPAAKPQQSNVRSGAGSYGEAKGRAPVAPSASADLDDDIPFAPAWK